MASWSIQGILLILIILVKDDMTFKFDNILLSLIANNLVFIFYNICVKSLY